MHSLTTRFLPCLALVVLAGPVQADILLSQPVIPGGVALASDFARFQQEADNFALTQPASVQSIQWWGAYTNNAVQADNFTLRLFSDAAGNPAQTPLVDVSAPNLTRTATNLVDNLGDPIFEYQADLPSPAALNRQHALFSVGGEQHAARRRVGLSRQRPGHALARTDDMSAWSVSSNSTSC